MALRALPGRRARRALQDYKGLQVLMVTMALLVRRAVQAPQGQLVLPAQVVVLQGQPDRRA